jgi:hypothetical protein
MEPVVIPSSFLEKYLWQPYHSCSVNKIVEDGKNFLTSSPSELQPTLLFPTALVEELQAVVSFAFSEATEAQTAPVQTPELECPIERTVTLTCPHEGGNLVIDSVVKTVAAEHLADVLVLDALELAAGEYGALGEGMRSWSSSRSLTK